ncbi:MAG TPA: SprT-like domain-containing protein [Nitrospira sp.]|nr:SprT-like domain-containing protein [Nitrospira sp.]
MRSPATISAALSTETLETRWKQLNARYFSNSLPPIPIRWSGRLTSSVGMFTSRGGPRTSFPNLPNTGRREIRLSRPLFEQLAVRMPHVEQELLNTLAHEMIHQWQFDILKRRPDHGLAFLKKMTQINRSGEVAVTTYHSLEKEVIALSRFVWQCTTCGRLYRRQRKTIQPQRHHCGSCRGALQELTSEPAQHNDGHSRFPDHASVSESRPRRPQTSTGSPEQLALELA